MAGRIQRELALLLTGKDVSMSKTVRGAEKNMAKLNRAGAKAGSNIVRNAERAVVVGAVAATGAVAFAVNQAMDFESSSASVRKTVEGNVDAILAANRKLSTATGLDANVLNEISATAGALGIAKDDIDDFTKTVALLGVTTDDVTTDLGATSLGHLKTTLGLAGSDFEHFGNDLVHLGNNGASTEGQILSMAENIAGAAATIGASTPQVLGWAAAVANTGEEAEAGGSSIQRFWLESFKSVNAGGSKLKLMAKTTGMTADSFKKAFGKDASGTLANFVVGLGKLSKAEQLATLQALGFKDIRITRALLKLLANTDNLTDSLADSTKGWEENNAATNEAQKRFETTASKMAIFNANVNDAAITIGSELLPVLADLSTQGTAWIQDHQGEIHQFAQDLSKGIKEAVIWAGKLDWEAIGSGLETAADAGRTLIEAFTSAPAWLQGFLITGFLANKFTGGAVMDVAGIILSQAVRGILGMTAGVVNINAGVVNGGGGGLPDGGGPSNATKSALREIIEGALKVAIPVAVATAVGTLVANNQAGIFNSPSSDPKAVNDAVKSGTMTFNGRVFVVNPDAVAASIAKKPLRVTESQGRQNAEQYRQMNVAMQGILARARAAGLDPTPKQVLATLHANQAREDANATRVRGAAIATAAAIRDKDLSINYRAIINNRVNINARNVSAATTSVNIRHSGGGGSAGRLVS